VQPGYEGGAKVARYNHKGCDAAEALVGGVVLATVTQTCWGAGVTYIYPIGVARRHAGETKKQKGWTRERTMVQWKREWEFQASTRAFAGMAVAATGCKANKWSWGLIGD
jgi:hypothetical protein